MESSRTQCDQTVLGSQGKKNRDETEMPGEVSLEEKLAMLRASLIEKQKSNRCYVGEKRDSGRNAWCRQRQRVVPGVTGQEGRYDRTYDLTGPVGNSDLFRRWWVGSDIGCLIMGAEGGEEALPLSR